MRDRRKQGIFLLFLAAMLSLFLMLHAVVVSVDFEACFGNLAAVYNQDQYARVGEMSFGALALAVGRQFSAEDMIVAGVGLLPLTPFAIAWRGSRDDQARSFWLVSALVACVVIVAVTLATGLEGFYDCDRSGVSLGILIAPILYAAVNVVVAFVLAGVRFFRS
jgi:hypothetical protein